MPKGPGSSRKPGIKTLPAYPSDKKPNIKTLPYKPKKQSRKKVY
jgi:hypothetical protein